VRQFRFNAAQTVRIHFKGEKTPENFRIDDMVEASINTLRGQAKLHFQYRLVSNDKSNPDGSERSFWFFDPKPVDASDSIDPSLWQPAKDATVAFYETAKGTPAAVKSWWYPGETTGYQFIFPRNQAMKIARDTGKPVLTTRYLRSVFISGLS